MPLRTAAQTNARTTTHDARPTVSSRFRTWRIRTFTQKHAIHGLHNGSVFRQVEDQDSHGRARHTRRESFDKLLDSAQALNRRISMLPDVYQGDRGLGRVLQRGTHTRGGCRGLREVPKVRHCVGLMIKVPLHLPQNKQNAPSPKPPGPSTCSFADTHPGAYLSFISQRRVVLDCFRKEEP